MFRLIDRYILREIAVPFCMILFVLTFILLMGKILQVMDLMINKGVAFFDIARLMLFMMPSFLAFTIPISLLIAILVGLGRLSGDNEWTVLKMSGIGLYRLSLPVSFAALITFLLTLATTLFFVPYGNHASKTLLFEMARQKATIGIQEKVFMDDFQGILLYADRIPVRGDFLEGVLIFDSRIAREPSTIIARRAYLIENPDTMMITLRLQDGSTHTVDSGLNHYRKMDFSFYDVRLDFASALSDGNNMASKSSTEMNLAELKKLLRQGSLGEQALRDVAIELHKKIAVPFSCLVFALIAIPLGIRAHRSVRSWGLTIGFFLVLIYYLLRIGAEALVEIGEIKPFIGAWMPNLVFTFFGITLLYLSAKEVSIRNGVRGLFCQPFFGA